MYRSFYNLKFKPFQTSSDPSFLWLGEKHQEALAILKYGILDNKGFLLMTGDVGTGKTTLINALLESLGEDTFCTVVPDPRLEQLEFYKIIAAGYGLDTDFVSKIQFLDQFSTFLHKAYDDNKKVLLIIDEAQLLTQDMLEEIRLLSNIEKPDAKLLNIFFVGQDEFNDFLTSPENRAVRQRLVLNYNIDPLTDEETVDYVEHRLRVAGGVEGLFTPEALEEIYEQSDGVPRRINIICDLALLSGYEQGVKEVDAAIVRQCADELDLPPRAVSQDLGNISIEQKTEEPVGMRDPITPHMYVEEEEVEEKKAKRGWLWSALASCAIMLVGFYFLFSYQNRMYRENIETYTSRIESLLAEQNGQAPAPPAVSTSAGESTSQPVAQQPPGETVVEESPPPILINPVIEQITAPRAAPPVQPAARPQPVPQPSRAVAEKSNNTAAVTDRQPVVSGKKEAAQNSVADKVTAPPPAPVRVAAKPAAPPLPEEVMRLRVKPNSDFLTDASYRTLDRFAEILLQHPDKSIIIRGYISSKSNSQANITLSERRANNVQKYLLKKGVAPGQMQVKGMGNQDPIASNDTSAGRRKNRRVEVEVVK